MKFYVIDYKVPFNSIEATFPCIVLRRDNWNDLGIFSLFGISYHKTQFEDEDLGNVKIIQRGRTKADIPESFEKLDFDFCSLGQSIYYYERIFQLFPRESRLVLQSLRDAAIFPDIRIQFQDDDLFKNSLIRFSEAEKALNEAKSIFGESEYQKGFQFSYATQLQFAENQHVASFNFEIASQLPSRIIGLVGRNGTGKTQYLADLAVNLSGYDSEKGHLLPQGKRPSFSRIFAVSYSPFDRFVRPPEFEQKFSYRYLGILRGKGEATVTVLDSSEEFKKPEHQLLSHSEMLSKLKEAAQIIAAKKRISYWQSTALKVIDPNIVNYFNDFLFSSNKPEIVLENEGKTIFSSGQNILLLILTELLAYLEEDSLILFDEPEMHLHPQAISSLIRMLNPLLEDLGCFAILATHSPIIIQEIPAKYVLVFDKVDNYPIIRSPNIETFGENLSILTSMLFDTENVDSTYKGVLERLSKQFSYEQLLDLFDQRLSLNTRLFLNQLYNKNDNL